MGDLLRTGNHSYLIDRPDLWAQPAMDTQHLPVDNRSQDEEIKDMAACFPYRGVAVFLLALFVETVYLGDLPGLVVSAYENDSFGVPGAVSMVTSASHEGFSTLPSSTSAT
jgi:hypothetical protein